jgi:hypothetical protein
MYVRVLQDELQFPDDRGIDQDTKSLIRGVCGCQSSFLVCMADFLSILVASTKPSPQDLRTTDKTTSIFFHDVSCPRYLSDVSFSTMILSETGLMCITNAIYVRQPLIAWQ